jgi:hypothetical protein
MPPGGSVAVDTTDLTPQTSRTNAACRHECRRPGDTVSYLAGNQHGRPTPQLVHLAAIHGYTTVFWCCAGIFAAGAVICGALLRRGPLTPA